MDLQEAMRSPLVLELPDVEKTKPEPGLEPVVYGSFPVMATRMAAAPSPYFYVLMEGENLPHLKAAMKQGLEGPNNMGNKIALRLDVRKNICQVIRIAT